MTHYKIIYTSSYDRGLEHLLKMWPDIKREVPEAELHIFYGWLLFKRFYQDNPERMQWMAKMQELMKQDGITDHGRVSQEEIKKAMKGAGIWAYPTHFGEISCISAMKAQCLGAIPVVVNYGALQTTVQHGIKVEGDIYDQETKDKFRDELVALLKDRERQEQIRVPMMEWANKEFSWAKTASQWDAEFKS